MQFIKIYIKKEFQIQVVSQTPETHRNLYLKNKRNCAQRFYGYLIIPSIFYWYTINTRKY